MLFPSRVQGAGAAEELASELVKAEQIHPLLDVIAIVRGGGSLEDLWSFNEEILVRAVAASTIPIISGIGHEIDLSLVDLVADVRGLTPTDAAVHIAVDRQQILDRLRLSGKRMNQELVQHVSLARQNLNRLAAAQPLASPYREINVTRRLLNEKGSAATARGIPENTTSKGSIVHSCSSPRSQQPSWNSFPRLLSYNECNNKRAHQLLASSSFGNHYYH